MKFGLAIMNDFPPGTVPADRLAQLLEQVRAASGTSVDSVWVSQHNLGNMPMLQPVPLLAALAADAGDKYLGTNMFILPLRHPVGVAEEFATLDHLTGRHLIAGFGTGYRDNEFACFGIRMDQRVTRFEENVDIGRSLWTGGAVSYTGKHFSIDDQQISLPPVQPVQPGGPRVWIGAGPHRTEARRAALPGDAWIIAPHVMPDRLQVLLGHYRDERERLGRGDAHDLVVRRELVLDDDLECARAVGIEKGGALTRKYAAFTAPDQTADYRQLQSDAAAEQTADRSYLFTDPAWAVTVLKQLQEQDFAYVVLRMQWYELVRDQTVQTLEMFRDHGRPAFVETP